MFDILGFLDGFMAVVWRGLRTLAGRPPTECATMATGQNVAAAVFVATIAILTFAGLIGVIMR